MLSFDLALRIPKLTMATAAKQSCTADWRWPTLIMVNGLLGGTAAAATSQRLNDFWPREQSTRALERAHRRRPLAGAAATQSGRSARTPETETERERWIEIERERPNDRGYSAEFQTIQTKDPYIIMACHGKLIHSQDDGCCAANSPLSPPQSVIIFQPLLCFCFCVSSSSSAFQFLPFLTPLFHCIFCFFFFWATTSNDHWTVYVFELFQGLLRLRSVLSLLLLSAFVLDPTLCLLEGFSYRYVCMFMDLSRQRLELILIFWHYSNLMPCFGLHRLHMIYAFFRT